MGESSLYFCYFQFFQQCQVLFFRHLNICGVADAVAGDGRYSQTAHVGILIEVIRVLDFTFKGYVVGIDAVSHPELHFFQVVEVDSPAVINPVLAPSCRCTALPPPEHRRWRDRYCRPAQKHR